MASKRTAVGTKNLIGFEVAGIHYAVNIQRVREIIRPLTVLPLPHMPKTIVGVTDHRGNVMPVIDLRVRFGANVEPDLDQRDERWIVVVRESKISALVVDRVTDVFGTVEAQRRAVPELGTGADQRGILAAYAVQHRLVFILDVDVLAAPAAQLDLSATAEAALPARTDDAR